MKYKAIFFDMDGTLVPMEIETFVKGYMKMLFMKLAKYGLDPDAFQKGMWDGVKAMVKNDGSRTNEEVFWSVFEKETGLKRETVNDDCLEFYGKEFHAAKKFTGENPLAVEAVRAAAGAAELVILSTNPLFPMVAQESRMSWVGLAPSDFDLITAYEEDRYCKPNPQYFLDICRRLNLQPQECLLIGNDEGEDMYAGSLAGLDCYLVTDWMIANERHPWNGPKGTTAEMIEMLKSLGN